MPGSTELVKRAGPNVFVGGHSGPKSNLHEVANMLNEELTSGQLPEDHVFLGVIRAALTYMRYYRAEDKSGGKFQWPTNVRHFAEELLAACHHSGYKLLRGPGGEGLGRNAPQTWKRFNIPLPSIRTHQSHSLEYLPYVGIYGHLLRYFHERAIVDGIDLLNLRATNVSLIPVVEANDTLAIAPACTYDKKHDVFVGVQGAYEGPKDLDDVMHGIKFALTRLRPHMCTDAGVTYLSTLCGKVRLPVGTLSAVSSTTEPQATASLLHRIRCLSICSHCSIKQTTAPVFVCNSGSCPACQTLAKAWVVDRPTKKFNHPLPKPCPPCAWSGHRSALPPLRACDSCLAEGINCVRCVVLATVSDCESHLLSMMTSFDDEVSAGIIDPEYALVTALPDATHGLKNLKQGAMNWNLVYKGQDLALRLMGTALFDAHRLQMLANGTHRQSLTGGDPQSIVAVTEAAQMWSLMKEEQWIITTPLPETLRLWDTNTPKDVRGVRDVAFHKRLICYVTHTTLMCADLHTPPNVWPLAKGLHGPTGIAISKGVVFVSTEQGLLYGELDPGAAELAIRGLTGKPLDARCKTDKVYGKKPLSRLRACGKRYLLLKKAESDPKAPLPFMLTEEGLKKTFAEDFPQEVIPADRDAKVQRLNCLQNIAQKDIDDATRLVEEVEDGELLRAIDHADLTGLKQVAIAAVFANTAREFCVFILCDDDRSRCQVVAILTLVTSKGLKVSTVRIVKLKANAKWCAISCRPTTLSAVVCGTYGFVEVHLDGSLHVLFRELDPYLPIVGVAAAANGEIYFTSHSKKGSWLCNITVHGVANPIIGNRVRATNGKDGPKSDCSLSDTAARIAVKRDVIVLVEADRIRRVSKTAALAEFLSKVHSAAEAFGMKVKDGTSRPSKSLGEASAAVGMLSALVEATRDEAHCDLEITRQTTGADGTFSAQTTKSTALLAKGLRHLNALLKNVYPLRKICLRCFVTDANEHFHSRIRDKIAMPTMAEFLQMIPSLIRQVADKSWHGFCR